MFGVHQNQNVLHSLADRPFLELTHKCLVSMLVLKRAIPVFDVSDAKFFLGERRVIQMREFAAVDPTVKRVFLNPDLKAIGIVFVDRV